jgi:hypothetical protein
VTEEEPEAVTPADPGLGRGTPTVSTDHEAESEAPPEAGRSCPDACTLVESADAAATPGSPAGSGPQEGVVGGTLEGAKATKAGVASEGLAPPVDKPKTVRPSRAPLCALTLQMELVFHFTLSPSSIAPEVVSTGCGVAEISSEVDEGCGRGRAPAFN